MVSSIDSGQLAQYRLLRILGQGGMGTVYLAQDTELDREVALKTMKAKSEEKSTSRGRFLREAKAAAKLTHDNIITVYQIGRTDDVPFLAMELLRGLPLDKRLQLGPPLSLFDVLKIARETAEGLHAAHEAGLVHRDIKPGNLWLEEGTAPLCSFKRTKILDFGLARVLTPGEADLTDPGALLGTPPFMAPEQARGEPLDGRADLFSLGCTLYLLTTGQRPFPGKSIGSVLMSLGNHTPTPPHKLNSEIPTSLSKLIEQLLQKSPKQRPKSARAVVESVIRIERDMTHSTLPKAMPVVDASTIRALETNPFGALEREAIQEKFAAGPPEGAGPGHRTPRKRWILAGAVGLLLVLAWLWIATKIFTVKTPRGTLVVESEDPSIEVLVQGEGATIRSQDREIQLTVGNYTIDLVDTKSGLKLSTSKFVIEEHGRTIVRARYEKPKEWTDREAARAMLESKGRVSVWVANRLIVVTEPSALPEGPLRLDSVNFYHAANRVRDDDLEVLKGAVHLTVLILQGQPRVTDKAMDYLGGLKQLTSLQLQGTRVGDKGLEQLAGLTKLELLYLSTTRVTDAGLPSLAKLDKLHTLSLHQTSVGDDGLPHLVALPMLTALNLSKTRVTDAGMESLSKLDKLKSLVLSQTAIGDRGIRHLAKLTKLEHLDLKGTKVTELGVRQLSDALPDCRILSDHGEFGPDE